MNEQEWSNAWYTNEVGYATLEKALAAAENQKTEKGKVSDAEFITLFGTAKLSRCIENPDYPIEVPKEAGIELDGNKINGVELIKGSKIRLTDSKGSGAAKLSLEDGSENEYKVPVGYTLTVYSDGRTELTRNPVPGNPKPNSNSSNNPYGIPSTGDNSNVALRSVLFLGFAALALVSGKKRRS